MRRKLKKVSDRPHKPIPKPASVENHDEIERQNLIFEMMGYMETPNGSIDDLLDKCGKSTAICRGFIYTLVNKGFVTGYRVMDEAKEADLPCTVFPGREVKNFGVYFS